MRRSLQSAQKGFALLLVMVIGTVALYSATSLIGDGTATERAAQERESLKLRAYWAAMGHITHALSRSRQGDQCRNICANMKKRTDFFDDVIKELQDSTNGAPKDPTKGKDRNWAYPEISDSYNLPMHLHVEDAENESRLVLRVHFQNANHITHPFILENWPVRTEFRAIICTGLTDLTTPCPALQEDMDENARLARIIRLEPHF